MKTDRPNKTNKKPSRNQNRQAKSGGRRRPRQMILQSQGHGGIREGAGRPKSARPRAAHSERPQVTSKTPLHVTVRLVAGVATLRSRAAYKVFRRAVLRAREKGLRVVHFAVLGNHFHLICEAASNSSLTRGMQSLNIQIAKGIKKLTQGTQPAGPIVSDRYDLKPLSSPRQVRNALIYVFANASKHFKLGVVFDWFCSFAVFEGLEQLGVTSSLDWQRPQLNSEQCAWFESMLSPPQSWLARFGWTRARSD